MHTTTKKENKNKHGNRSCSAVYHMKQVLQLVIWLIETYHSEFMAKKTPARNKSCRFDYFMLTGCKQTTFLPLCQVHLHDNPICLLVDGLLILNNLQINKHSFAGDDQDP